MSDAEGALPPVEPKWKSWALCGWYWFCWPFKTAARFDGDRLIGVSTFLLVLATLGLVIVAHSTDEKVGRQISALERQLTLLELDQRPWVSMRTAVPWSPLVITENSAEIVVQFVVRNSGKSPARFVRAEGSFFFALANEQGVAPLATIYGQWASCAALRDQPMTSRAGIAVFPGADETHNHVFRMKDEQLAAWRSKKLGAPMIVGCRAGSGCLNRIPASISGASAGVRLPRGMAVG
jgi:hypothetical protein